MMENDDVIRSLIMAEERLCGVIRMAEGREHCIDIIRQIQTVESALDKVSSQILADRLNSCTVTALQGSDRKERERVLKEITKVLEISMKV